MYKSPRGSRYSAVAKNRSRNRHRPLGASASRKFTTAPNAPFTGDHFLKDCRRATIRECAPSIPPSGVSPDVARKIAQAIDHFVRVSENQFARGIRNKVRLVSRRPKLVETNRHRAIRLHTNMAERLQPVQKQLADVLGKSAQSRRLNIHLISAMVTILKYGDATLPPELTKGMEISGGSPSLTPNRTGRLLQ